MSTKLDELLASLNHEQLKAVTAPVNTRLQIIAGPGTGKTKVLILRVAYLILAAKIPPEHMIVTTFTKKAAKEMIERLEPVMEHSGIDISKLLIGTFHSICYRIIRRYGTLLGLNNFTIADERDSSQILQDILSNLTSADLEVLENLPTEETDQFKNLKKENDDNDKYHGYCVKRFKSSISKIKSSSETVKSYGSIQGHNRALFFIYQKYQSRLQKEFLLDFDDCLLECYSLITQKPVLNFVKHVLVDEFQDTNELQLKLMYEFGRGHPTDTLLQHNVTIVGDPDQSIYAFREAQVINFKKMEEYYSKKLALSVTKVLLTQNYRSTTDILYISESIMKQQQNRQCKNLISQYQVSFRPVHQILSSTTKEAKWIAYNIMHLKSLPNDAFKYSDFSVLVRSAYQTRAIEKELLSQRIPYKMVRGKAFWDRKEVVAIVDHLRVISNPYDRVGFLRTLTLPKKGVGEKTLQKINNYLSNCDLSKGDIQIHTRNFICISSLPEKAKHNIISHIDFIDKLRSRIVGIEYDQLEEFFETVYRESGLYDEFQEDESCDGNIREVQKQLVEFRPQDDDLTLYIGGQDNELATDDRNIITKFITSIGLYETTEDENDNDLQSSEGKVALSTIHGSKGLEWPVVFVPGLSEGSLPSKFSIDAEVEAIKSKGKVATQHEPIDEERRCFYVATTRAKHILFLSSVVDDNQNGNNWGNRYTSVSRFLNNVDKCDKLVSCFSNIESLKQLYSIKNIETIDSNFNVEKYYTKFKKFMKHYLAEDYMKVEPLDYDNIDLDDDNVDQDVKSFNKKFNTSITTARNVMVKRSNEEIISTRKKMMVQQRKTLGKQSTLKFKSPKPVLSTMSVNTSKAPKYDYKSTTRTLNEAKVNNLTNRAPVYIPERKRTSKK